MGDASLSQDEIDALLMGADDVEDSDFGGGMGSPQMDMGGGGGADYSALGPAFNEAMTTAANSAGSLVSKNVSLGPVTISEMDSASASNEIPPGSVLVSVNLGQAQAAIVMDEAIAKKISMTMMGSPSEPAQMDEAHLSTLGELVNTVFSSVSNSLAAKINDNINPSPPDSLVFQSAASFPPFSGNVCKFDIDMNIDELGSGKFTTYIDQAPVAKWASAIGGVGVSPAPAQAASPAPQQQQAAPAGGVMGGMFGAPQAAPSGPAQSVSPIDFPSLTGGAMGQQTQMPSNIDLLMDVQMVMTVELGRTKKYVKDILSLGEGSIIELDKLAGEPVDLLVNGKLIAKGEVVVIDENFGVRVTDIVGPSERLARLTS